VTTALASAEELLPVATLRHRYGTIALVLFEQSAWQGGTSPATRLAPAGSRLIRVGAGTTFAAAWTRAFGAAEQVAAGSHA
jgi:hypothetical protein